MNTARQATWTPERRALQSQVLKQLWETPSFRKLMHHKNVHNNPMFVAKNIHKYVKSRFAKNGTFNPKLKGKVRPSHSRFMKKIWQVPQYRTQQALHGRSVRSRRMKQLWRDPMFRERASKRGAIWCKKLWAKPQFRVRFTELKRQLWSDPQFRARMSRTYSRSSKRMWADQNFRKLNCHKIAVGLHVRPNKKEIQLGQLLQEMPNQNWKYVGDFKFFIGRKNPDFIDFKHHRIIELFGRHWHKASEVASRINYFKHFGYDCLVIWDSDLLLPSGVIKAVRKKWT